MRSPVQDDVHFTGDTSALLRFEDADSIQKFKDMSYSFSIQSADERVEDLLKLDDSVLGRLVKTTWVPGQYIKYKRMLLQEHQRQHSVDFRTWSVEERFALLQQLESDLQAQMAARQASAPSSTPPLSASRRQSTTGSVFDVQSVDEIVSAMDTEDPQDTVEAETCPTVQYLDSNPGTLMNFNPIIDNSYYSDFTSNTDLNSFLSRPVLIKTATWNSGSDLSLQAFTPWSLFFSDTRIAKKIDNYSLISCNLKVKFIINASPFYYGMAIAAYQPLVQNIAGTYNGFGYATNYAANDRTKVMTYSQLPHIFIYPQVNQAGEMTLPFVHYRNWLRVNSLLDFKQMGTIYLQSLTNLQSANGATGAINIQVYAWAEDVRVCAPTCNLAVQSRDEYEPNGVISAPASALAKAAGLLTKIPVIGRYMTATSMILDGVANVASLFGYTNNPVIRDVEPMKNLPFHGMASSEISTPAEKLTLDPKNELSIDPAIVGLGSHDCMSITSFVQREAVLETFEWALSDAVDTLICASQVLPELIRIETVSSHVYRTATPMAHVQHMFSYWRGDIIFRFRFICTKYHRGRVRITYDPDGDIKTNTVTSTVCFTRIVDISSESDIEIRVPYMQAYPWLNTANTVTTEYYGDSTFSYARYLGSSNGVISMRVFTEASAPATVAPIIVVMSVRGADNLEFAAPKELPTNLSWYDVQSADELAYENPMTVSASNDPVGSSDPHRFLVNHGEVISTFRQYLRRTVLSRIANVATNTTAKIFCGDYFFARRPLGYGYDPNGIDTADKSLVVGTAPFNFVFQTPYNYLAPCFLGERGSHRWTINVDSPRELSTIRTSRNQQGRITTDYYQTNALTVGVSKSAVARFPRTVWNSGLSGCVLANQHTQTGISVEAPMYSNYRMQSTNPDNITLGSTIDATDVDTIKCDFVFKPSYNSDKTTEAADIHFYHGIGTDFTFLLFLFVPTMVVYSTPTAP